MSRKLEETTMEDVQAIVKDAKSLYVGKFEDGYIIFANTTEKIDYDEIDYDAFVEYRFEDYGD